MIGIVCFARIVLMPWNSSPPGQISLRYCGTSEAEGSVDGLLASRLLARFAALVTSRTQV